MSSENKQRVRKWIAWLSVVNAVATIYYGFIVDSIDFFDGFIYASILITMNVFQVMLLVSLPSGVVKFSQDAYMILPIVFCNLLTLLVIGRFCFAIPNF